MIAVILIRGLIDAKSNVLNSLKRLRLNRKNHLVLINEKPDLVGLVKRVKDYVAYGVINDDVLEKLIVKRGRLGGNKTVPKKDVSKMIKDIKAGKWPEGLKHVFRLSPPRKGFKHSIKKDYPYGALGNHKEKINDLILKMI